MDEDVDAAPEAVVDPADGVLEVGADVDGGGVEDVEAVGVEGVVCGVGEPGGVEDLDEGGDAVGVEEGLVEGGDEGADVEGAGAGVGRGGEDEVHGGAHGLHDLGRERVEADHRGASGMLGSSCVCVCVVCATLCGDEGELVGIIREKDGRMLGYAAWRAGACCAHIRDSRSHWSGTPDRTDAPHGLDPSLPTFSRPLL